MPAAGGREGQSNDGRAELTNLGEEEAETRAGYRDGQVRRGKGAPAPGRQNDAPQGPRVETQDPCRGTQPRRALPRDEVVGLAALVESDADDVSGWLMGGERRPTHRSGGGGRRCDEHGFAGRCRHRDVPNDGAMGRCRVPALSE